MLKISIVHYIINSRDLDVSKLVVRGGTKMRGVNGKPVGIAQIILHPEYNPDTFDKDIGLIQASLYNINKKKA